MVSFAGRQGLRGIEIGDVMNSTRDDIQRMLDHLDCTDRSVSAEDFRRHLNIHLQGILEDRI